MNWVTVVWLLVSGACLMLALMHLAMGCRERNSSAVFWFFIAGIASVLSALVGFGSVKLPLFASIPLFVIVLAVGMALSRDLLRAGSFSGGHPMGKSVDPRQDLLVAPDPKRADQEAARQHQELARISRINMLGELAGAIAHELNQPLAAILGNAQVGRGSLNDKSPDLVEMAAILDDIAADAKRAGGIIHGMRAMFKKETGGEWQPVDLNEVVTQVLHLLHSELLARKVQLQAQLEPGLPPVRASRVEIQQILINLLMNALDATKGGADNALEIHTRRLAGRVEFSIRDHGPGIPLELETTLFEPFVSTKSEGLGLGLAISRSIARRFHGELRAENHPHGGAVFELSLPVATDVEPVATHQAAGDKPC